MFSDIAAIKELSAVTQYVKDPLPDNPSDNRSLLGNGGFGVTYRMRNLTEDELYAVKIISVEVANRKGFNKIKLFREVKVLRDLTHPNIVRYFACFYSLNDTLFNVVMELVTGGVISSKIKDLTVTMNDIVKWWSQLASALCYMHFEKDFLHGDIKPDNIMLTGLNNVKIIDLGLAAVKNSNSAVRSSGAVGTQEYFSYERALCEPYDGRDDVWAAGCVIAELMTNKSLQEGYSHIRFVDAIRVNWLSECFTRDAKYGGIVGKMLETKQYDRCDARELVELLNSNGVSSVASVPVVTIRTANHPKLSRLKDILKASTPDFVVKQHLNSYNYQPNSRVWLHAEIDTWLAATPSNEKDLKNKVFWLQAGAGMGKSVFAAALVDRMNREQDYRLLGAVFIKFSDEKQSNPINVLKSLIYQIAVKYPETIDIIFDPLKEIENESALISIYYENILIPALNAINSRVSENYLIIIDALDEANTSLKQDLLSLFNLKFLHKLPIWVKLFVTGRDEVDIKERLLNYSHIIDEHHKQHAEDLSKYIVFSLQQVFSNDVDIEEARLILLEKSEGNFLYTALVAEEIAEWYSDGTIFSKSDFVSKLKCLPKGIDESYTKTFNKLSKVVRPDKCQLFLLIMVSCLEPLTENELKYLLNMESENEAEEFNRLIASTNCTFPLREINEGDVTFKRIFPYHKTLFEWLTDFSRSSTFFCSKDVGNRIITEKLLVALQISNSDSNFEISFNESHNKIERYLFRHFLYHLEKCSVKYQTLNAYDLLTCLTWIQSWFKLFGLSWCIQEYRYRSTMINISEDCRSDAAAIFRLLVLLTNCDSKAPKFDWSSEICTHIDARFKKIQSSRIERLRKDALSYISEFGGWLIENSSIPCSVDLIISFPSVRWAYKMSHEFIVLSGYSALGVWNVSTGECVYFSEIYGFWEGVMSVVFDGSHIICGLYGGAVHKLDYSSGKIEFYYDFQCDLHELFLFPNGAIGCLDKKYCQFIATDLTLVSSRLMNCSEVCILSNDFVAYADANVICKLRVWNLIENKSETIFQLANYVIDMKVTSNLLVCLSDKIRIFRIHEFSSQMRFELIFEFDCGIMKEVFVFSAEQFVCVGKDSLLQYRNGNIENIYYEDAKYITAVLTDGRVVARGYHRVIVADPKKFEPIRETYDNICLLSDGRIVTSKYDRIFKVSSISIWNFDNKATEWNISGRRYVAFCGLSDGKLACGVEDDLGLYFEIWDVVNQCREYETQVNRIYKYAGDFFLNIQQIGSFIVIRSKHRRWLFDLKLKTYQLFADSDNVLQLLRENNALHYHDEDHFSYIPLNKAPTFGFVSDGYFINGGYILLCFIKTKRSPQVYAIIESSTNKEVIMDIDWSTIPSGAKFPVVEHLFYVENELQEGIRLNSGNHFVFLTKYGELIYATYYPKRII